MRKFHAASQHAVLSDHEHAVELVALLLGLVVLALLGLVALVALVPVALVQRLVARLVALVLVKLAPLGLYLGLHLCLCPHAAFLHWTLGSDSHQVQLSLSESSFASRPHQSLRIPACLLGRDR